MKIQSKEDLKTFKVEGLKSLYPDFINVKVGLASCGKAAGAEKVLNVFKDEVGADESIEVSSTGCLGLCSKEPLVEVVFPDGLSIVYKNVDEDFSHKLAEDLMKGEFPNYHVLGTRGCSNSEEGLEEEFPDLSDLPFYKKQRRIVLSNSGFTDPESLEEYIARDGFFALSRALSSMEPEVIIEELKNSNLRGRGGAGFPTGVKWEFLRKAEGDSKYLICNADEGDPGAYMDRSLLEGDPFSVIEGMIIGGFATGAGKGIIYVRAEYPLAVARIKNAIEKCRKVGLLGENIFGENFKFDIEIKKGAGAFVCGEETALIASIESKRGRPRTRPPFPAQSGLYGKPTNINNVETWANVPQILRKGSDWFSEIGTENSGGTKIFSLTGDVRNTGLVEVPLGTSLEDMIFEIGGGVTGGEFKAVQTGGPSGGVIPEQFLDTPIDYETLDELGSIMGSGGMIVMSSSTCMVDQAKFFIDFCTDESCGKCTPCRYGTKKMLEILERITQGKGVLNDFEELESLGNTVKEASLCGLGQTAANPVISTLEYFRDEYESHILDGRCPAGQCPTLITSYRIDPEACTGCDLCSSECPVDAISGEQGETHKIDENKCIGCGSCAEVCPVNAISKGGN
ncbi:MAG: NADH-quinone oxidoreductase subunit NuoF [Candidatus Hadarchaeota archaeon]